MGRRVFDATEMAAQHAEWEVRERGLEGLLKLHAAVLEAVRVQVTPLWEALVHGKKFARKPSYGLRLFGREGQTLVGISPSYNRRTKTVDSGFHLVEVIGEVERYLAAVNPCPFYQLERRLTLLVVPSMAIWRQFRKTYEEDLEGLVAILEDFLIEPDAVLGRSTTYCAICGRHLTDGQSCARGIGPECLRYVSTWFGYKASLFGGADAVSVEETYATL